MMTAAPRLHRLVIPTPFPVGPVNVYLAEGEPLTLIDTGPRWDTARAALEAGLAGHGYRLEQIQRLILTHHHADHVGLAGEIVARSGAEVVAHVSAAPWLSDLLGHHARHRPFFRQLWDEGGVPEAVIAAMDESGLGIARWMTPVTPTRLVDEGDELDFAGATWRVYHTPGHAGDLICLWDPASRVLLANDHLLRDISSNPTLEPPAEGATERPRRLVEYLQHLRRMTQLPVALAWPGHGEPVEDVPGLVASREAFHTRRKERLAGALAGRPQTLWELTQATFGDRLKRGMDWFLGCSEILGHLDLLEADGEVRPQLAGQKVKWEAGA